ncbi:uncharacterized protein B0T15DRAFT_512560 [Chaetomium strumarium]|uniref:Myb-like DNA-binding domain-containing protein n=1 Tax=Chaetomium strumarium TaxID=1170767 RepID=A0AAJ0GQT9_9PEZI|nr:hypothetical protein B0T15DRAFT_512560 [Chaetomium strumarium]
MPPQDIEGQFKFLLCCVKHSSAGKVNFDAVATELDIVSKAAAAKRYERLLKAHNITIATPRKGAGSNNDGDADTPAPRKRKRATATKRENGVTNNDSSEEGTPVKKERRAAVKKERGIKKEESVDDEDDVVKTEHVEDPEETEEEFISE